MVKLLNPFFSITGSFKYNHRWQPLVTDQASKNRRARQFIVKKHERVHARLFATGGVSERIGDRRHALSNHVAGGQILPFDLQHKGFD